MKRLLPVFLLMIFLPSWAAAQQAIIGKVKTASGQVEVVRQGKEAGLQIGDPLFQHDTIRTGKNSRVGVIFEDNTVLSLGPKSEIVIDEYVFAPEKGLMSMVTRMLKGTASYLSGIIGRQSPEAVKFQTPDATIGIRGTHFLVKVS